MNERRLKIDHIVNPIIVTESSDLFFAQPISFETMKVAQKFAAEHVNVTLYSAQFPEDHPIVPTDFLKTPDLKRSVLALGNFKIQRKLPLIKDILDRLYEVSDADYLIYTNSDIAVLPHFYLSICKIINQGYDAFVINRRTISKDYYQVKDIPLMYAEIGQPHPGYDCFIFARKVYPKYQLCSVCIGTNWIGKALLVNLICNAWRFQEFKDLHLTFHRGDDRVWLADEFADYALHNYGEICKLITSYHTAGRLSPHPLVKKIISQLNLKIDLE